MAISAEQLNVILSARDREFTRAMDRAQRKVDGFARQSNKSLLSAGNAFKTLSAQASAFLPALSAAIVVQQVRRVVSELDQIGKTADSIGLTTDALQELRVIAEEAGVAQDSLDNSMMQFSKRLGEAQQGTGAARTALEKLKLTSAELAAMPLDQALQAVAERMTTLTSATDRTAIATQLFGRQGVGMLNMLRLGAEGMEAARQNARDLGIVIDEELIRNAEAAENQLGLMSRVIDANLTTALINLAPFLVSAAEGVAGLTTAVRGFFDSMGASRAENEVEGLSDQIKLLEDQIAAFEAGATDSNRLILLYGSADLARERLEKLRSEFSALSSEMESGSTGAAAPIINEADLSLLQDAVDAERERARLAALTAEERERARISAEADALVQQALANISGTPFTVETTAARIEAEALREEYIAAATAASSILNPVKAVAAAGRELPPPAETAAEAYEKMLTSMIAASPALKALGFDAGTLQSTMQMVESSMESAFMSMVDGTMKAKQEFRSMASDIIRKLYRVLVVQRLVGGITSALGFPAVPSGGPVVGAASGRSMQAGQPAVVGEHGRELFVPQTAGRVLSVSQAQSAVGGGGSVIVNQTINVSTGVQQTVRSEIKQLMPQIAESAKAAVVDAKRRGGSYGRAFS